jgi:hypothetical protein
MPNRDSFLIALNSDGSMEKHPENVPSDFTAHFPTAISLSGDWEVALIEASFPHEWYEIRSVVGVHIISSMETIRGDVSLIGDLLRAKPRPPPDTGWAYEVATLATAPQDIFKYNYGVIPSGEYSTAQQLGDMLSAVVTHALAPVYSLNVPKYLDYKYDPITKTGHYSISHDQLSVFLVFEQTVLADALGLTYRRVLPVLDSRDATNGAGGIVSFDLPEYRTVYFLTGNSGTSVLRKPILMHGGSIDTIYIYSDIAERQLVGDVVAPLLGIVPIKAVRGSRQVFTFKSPTYLPVSKQDFSSIRVKLRTERGKPVPFPENSSNVVCMLHFRRYNPYI